MRCEFRIRQQRLGLFRYTRDVDAVRTREAVDVRPLAAGELRTIERALPRYPGKHRERLDGQERGDCVYLIAWAESEPVGHLNLRLGGQKMSERARRIGAAHIEDLAVAPSHRRRRVGTQLMRRAEAEAVARGFQALGLGVDVDNNPARRLYAQEGYEESGSGEFLVSYPFLDERGAERQAHERCTYLIKRLG
jgi:ribosomal protein S18 acetylase RimI-like enzyme